MREGNIRMLNIIDEFTHECLAIRIDRKLKSVDVIDVLSDLFTRGGVPERLRSDNGPKFVAKAVQDWIAAVGAKAAYIAPVRSWENGFIESFNARLRDELLNGEIFDRWRRPGSWSKAGGATTTLNARTRHWATSFQRLKCSSPRSPRGRRLKIPASCAVRASTQPHLER